MKFSIELSPEIYVVVNALCDFYKKRPGEIVEVALEHLAGDAKLISTTISAMKKQTAVSTNAAAFLNGNQEVSRG